MIVQQTQNAFNDKMAQFILIPLGGAIGVAVESAAGLLIALPFVLFAPLAGWLSDRFSKRDVMIGSALLQLLVLTWICGSIVLRNMPLALCGFFALAVQSVFFSPAKIGINKELVGSRHLGFASSIQQMTVMLAILSGQIVAGWVFDRRYHALGAVPGAAWQAALGPMILLTLCAVPALLLAWIIPRVPAQGGGRFTARVFTGHFAGLAELWRHHALRRASFGVAFFWGFAAFINLWSVKLAREITGGGAGYGTLSSMFMAAASLGMAAGFGGASFLLRRRIELGWVPLAGLLMAVASLVLAVIPMGGTAALPGPGGPGPLALMRDGPWQYGFLAVLALLAFASAVFLAPLNAWMQDHYPPDKRGELQAAVNLQDCIAGIIAVLLIMAFEALAGFLGIAPPAGFRLQMGFIALACLVAALLMIRILPADFIRIIGVAVVRLVYRIRTAHPARVPAKGGVLLLANHVTYADAFFLSAACPRPVRFVMDEAFTENRVIRAFTGIFATVTIRLDHPLDAIREIIRALKNGDVVCMFPEGRLTRTGTLCALRRGFGLIAGKSGHPVIPVWCDGSWGSIFSFERDCFFRKLPRRLDHGITIAFGRPLEPEGADVASVRDALLSASSEALARRFAARGWSDRLPRAKHAGAAAFRAATAADRRRFWANGHQIGMVNALRWRQPLRVLADDPVLAGLPGLTAAFPVLFHARLRICETFDGGADGVWVGGDTLRRAIGFTQITAGNIVFHDFGTEARVPVERAGLHHFPGLAAGGVVLALSMPHPPAANSGLAPQAGHKPRAWGKLLPGWHLAARPEDGALVAHGPAAPAHGLPLPPGCALDEDGFVVG